MFIFRRLSTRFSLGITWRLYLGQLVLYHVPEFDLKVKSARGHSTFPLQVQRLFLRIVLFGKYPRISLKVVLRAYEAASDRASFRWTFISHPVCFLVMLEFGSREGIFFEKVFGCDWLALLYMRYNIFILHKLRIFNYTKTIQSIKKCEHLPGWRERNSRLAICWSMRL